ncbi:MAG: hypothetical protein OEU54_10175 [Gemmatimonadota bacterium]|nr:hypothetical protein [Gemmatimonadota bacterium]
MTGRQWKRQALPGIVALMLTLTGCGSGGPTGVPYRELGRDLAGVYLESIPGSNLGMRLVLGTRHTLTGRYESESGEIIRFQGTWERDGNELFVTFDGPELPSGADLGVAKETIRTLIPRSPFSMEPENVRNFLEQEVMRISGVTVVRGVQIQLDLIRVITDIVSGGGGPQRN